MPVEIGCQLAQLVDFMAQVLNHHFQICHMVIGKALYLLLFANLKVLFLHLCLKRMYPVPGLCKFFIRFH